MAQFFGGSGGSGMRRSAREWYSGVSGKIDSMMGLLEPYRQTGMGYGSRVRSFLSGDMRGSERMFGGVKGETDVLFGNVSRATGKSRATREVAKTAIQSTMAARQNVLSPIDRMYGMGIEAAGQQANLHEQKAAAILQKAGLMGAGYDATAAGKGAAGELLGTILGGMAGGGAGSKVGGGIGATIGSVMGRKDRKKAERKLKRALKAAGVEYDAALGKLRPVSEQGAKFMGEAGEAIEGRGAHTRDFRSEVMRSVHGMGRGLDPSGVDTAMMMAREGIAEPLFGQAKRGLAASAAMTGMTGRHAELTGKGMEMLSARQQSLSSQKMQFARQISGAISKGFSRTGGTGAPGMDGSLNNYDVPSSVQSARRLGTISPETFAGGLR